jgi:predicted ester cyclase
MRRMDEDRAAVEERYRRYLAYCNERRFAELGEFVAADVRVGGERVGLRRYGDGLAGVVRMFPDFHWTLERLVVEGEWMSARLTDTGTARDGRRIAIQEFALYRLSEGRISEAWGDLDRWRLEAAPDTGR